MKILEATQKDSHVLAQMATKIWDNENVDELEEEFTVSTEKTIPILLKIKSLLLFLKVILSE